MNNIKHVTSIKHRAQKYPRVGCGQGRMSQPTKRRIKGKQLRFWVTF